MHFEHQRDGHPPIMTYDLTLVTDTGRVAARLRAHGDGITLQPNAGYSTDSWTNDQQTETRVELKHHEQKKEAE